MHTDPDRAPCDPEDAFSNLCSTQRRRPRYVELARETLAGGSSSVAGWASIVGSEAVGMALPAGDSRVPPEVGQCGTTRAMLLPLLPPRLHGVLDDVVVCVYLIGLWLLGLEGAAAAIAASGATLHFALTRFTDYPQGTFRRTSFRTHAFIELGEGIGVLLATFLLTDAHPLPARAFLAAMGASQFVAFAFSDYRTPVTTSP